MRVPTSSIRTPHCRASGSGYVHLRHQPERAQPLFESALERNPDSVNGHIGLGLSLLAGGNRDDGLRHLQRAVELDPKSPKAQAALGVSLDQLGRREEAVAHLEAARNLRPHDSRILNNLGVAYLRSGQPERAEPLLRAALREDQRDVPLRQNNLGMALAMQGRFDEALEAFRGAGDEQSARSRTSAMRTTRAGNTIRRSRSTRKRCSPVARRTWRWWATSRRHAARAISRGALPARRRRSRARRLTDSCPAHRSRRNRGRGPPGFTACASRAPN